MAVVNFADTQLQACFERNLAGVDPADELRQVRASMLTHAWFRMLEGPHSNRVHDTIDVLLSRDLRPGLQQWYRRPGASLDAQALTVTDHLSQLAGERNSQPNRTAAEPQPGLEPSGFSCATKESEMLGGAPKAPGPGSQ